MSSMRPTTISTAIDNLIVARAVADLPPRLSHYETAIQSDSTYLHPDDSYLLPLIFKQALDHGNALLKTTIDL